MKYILKNLLINKKIKRNIFTYKDNDVFHFFLNSRYKETVSSGLVAGRTEKREFLRVYCGLTAMFIFTQLFFRSSSVVMGGAAAQSISSVHPCLHSFFG